MAMFAINIFIGFLKVSVLYTINTMREFLTSETRIKLRATRVAPTFSASGFIRLEQLQELNDPLAVVFMLTGLYDFRIRMLIRGSSWQSKC